MGGEEGDTGEVWDVKGVSGKGLEGDGEGGGCVNVEGEGDEVGEREGDEGGKGEGEGECMGDGDGGDGTGGKERQNEGDVALPKGLSHEDLVEEELTASDTSVVQQARKETRAAGRFDTNGLSPEKAKKKLAEHQKTLVKAARQRYRFKRNSHVGAFLVGLPPKFQISTIQAVNAERGLVDRFIQTADVYNIKAEIIHHACEVAEYYSLTLHFPVNSMSVLKAVVDPFHGFGESSPIFAHAIAKVNLLHAKLQVNRKKRPQFPVQWALGLLTEMVL